MCNKVTHGMLMGFWDYHNANVDSRGQGTERILYAATLTPIDHILAGIESKPKVFNRNQQTANWSN